MPVRTLVATMGADDRQVLPAMRLLPYDRLVLVAGADAFESEGYRRLEALEPFPRKVSVDPYDLPGCLEALRRTLRESSRDGPARLSVGGGSKILTSAAILAAFQEGVEAWYCDPEPVRLPILRGFRFEEMFGPDEKALAQIVRRAVPFDRLLRDAERRGLSRLRAARAVRTLAGKGLLEVRAVDGTTVVRPTSILPAMRPHLRGPAAKP